MNPLDLHRFRMRVFRWRLMTSCAYNGWAAPWLAERMGG